MADLELMLSALWKRPPMRARERWTRQHLEAYQARELRALRDYACAHSPFYREFHKGLYEAPLQNLPVLTKSILMDHFDDLATDRAIHLGEVKAYVEDRRGDERFLGRYWVNSTSGTSGHPGLFVVNRDEWSMELATAIRAFESAGLKLNLARRTRIAQITSTNPSHLSMQGGRDMANWWMPTLLMAASEPLASMVERLNAWRPEMLWAYASIIHLLADEQIAGRLKIAPHTVLSASELLTQGIRRRAVAAWGDVVFDTYATTDCGGIGAECDQHSGMHLQEDVSIIEVVDRDNQPVEPGVFGDKLLVTVLGSRTLPLIRYELEDSVRLARSMCPCGRPFRLIDAVRGRVEESLSFPAAAGGVVTVHPIVFSNIMDTLPVSGWQVLQDADGLHVLLCGISGALDEEKLARSVRDALKSQGVANPVVEIERVASIPQTTAGKTPLVRSILNGIEFRGISDALSRPPEAPIAGGPHAN
jgi:phenylacetate-CoA ligase